MVKISAIKIKNKIEIFAEIFGSKPNGLNLTVCRIRFKEIESLYKIDELGSGLFTLSIDQAKTLNAELTKVLCGS